MWLYHRVKSPNNANRMANSVERSSLIWVCTVCPGISGRKFRIITVCSIFLHYPSDGVTEFCCANTIRYIYKQFLDPVYTEAWKYCIFIRDVTKFVQIFQPRFIADISRDKKGVSTGCSFQLSNQLRCLAIQRQWSYRLCHI